jgi:hypothetical protein
LGAGVGRPRRGRTVLGLAVEAGLLASDSPKAPVRLSLPAKALDSYFPQLFPFDPSSVNAT